jgi:hypothetical protein
VAFVQFALQSLTGLFLKKVNGEFEQFAKDWGCTRPLNYKPYSLK